MNIYLTILQCTGFAIGYVFDLDKESFGCDYSDDDDINKLLINIFFTLYAYSIVISAISLLFSAAACIKFLADVKAWIGEGCYMAERVGKEIHFPSHYTAYAFQRNGGVSNLGWITLNKKYTDYINKSFLYGLFFFMIAMVFSFFGKGMDLWIAIPCSVVIIWVACIVFKMWNRSYLYEQFVE